MRDEFRPFPDFRLNLSQGGAGHFIDGTSGDFSGEAAPEASGPVGPRRAAITHAIDIKRIRNV
jgi:hypothetical protein